MIEKIQPIKDQAIDIVIISKKAFESVEDDSFEVARGAYKAIMSEIREIQESGVNSKELQNTEKKTPRVISRRSIQRAGTRTRTATRRAGA